VSLSTGTWFEKYVKKRSVTRAGQALRINGKMGIMAVHAMAPILQLTGIGYSWSTLKKISASSRGIF